MGIRVNRNLSLKERKTYTFDNFKGVDFSTSPHKVAGNRAVQAKNLIYEDGTVRKRNGWQSLCKLDGKINGIFSFEIEGEKVILCYAGTNFYRLYWNEEREQFVSIPVTDSCTYAPAQLNVDRLVERRVQVFINSDKAYIVGCGDYLVYGKWGGDFELRRVYNNEDVYIPTTTINIDEDSVTDEHRGTRDGVNLLSPYRKNEFLGVDAESGTWTVDTVFKDVAEAINAGTFIEIKLYTYDEDGTTRIEIDINNRLTGDNRTNLYRVGDDTTIVGTVDYTTGKITLNINTKPQEENTSNIVVTFEKSEAGQEDIIANAYICTMFGANGNSNRLFVVGAGKYENTIHWSDYGENDYDFSYFPSNNVERIGSNASKINGFVRVSDGTLLAFKDNKNNDAVVYYITAEWANPDIADEEKPKIKLYQKAGNIADTIYAPYATANLNGDNLILTRNGVRGLQLYENVAINNYRVQERGRNINWKLLQHKNLSDACGFVFSDKYFLSVEGVVYIADGRFTFQNEEDINGSFNYEWWYWTNVDARVWCNIDNELYFGTTDGLICKFTNEYADVTYQDTEAGDLMLDIVNNKVVYNMGLDRDLSEDDEIVIDDSLLFAEYLESNEMSGVDEDGYIVVPEETINKLYDGIKVYADRVGDTGLELFTEYEIGIVDRDNLRFMLLRGDEQVIPTGVGFRFCKNISGKTLYVTNIDHENSEFQVREFLSGDVLQMIVYNYSLPTNLLAVIKYKQNVRAEWYTPIYDLGTNMFSKTLLNITIATEPLPKGSITAGYQTRNLEKDFSARGAREFDFNDINFEDFSFEGSFASSFTLRVKERNFNFIVVRYISDNQNSCAVNSITIRYKVNQINKGVR